MSDYLLSIFNRAAIVAVLLFAFASGLVWIGSMNGIAPSVLVRDPAAEFHFPFYAGLISYLGVAALIATAAVTGFASRLTLDQARLLGLVSFFSAILAFDDLFTLHEFVLPLILGVPEKVVYGVYAILFGLICLRVWALRRTFAVSGFFVALMFLGLSVLLDIVKSGESQIYWLEDALKIAGFGAWMIFWMQVSAQLLMRQERPR